MNLTLWMMALRQAKGLALSCALLLFAFHWLFVWLASLIDLGWLSTFLKMGLKLPLQGLFPIPPDQVGTPGGMISLAFVDPVVLFTLTVWAIARGSNAVSGPLDRGTLEMVLAQPVRRVAILGSHAGATLLGSALLATACWSGTAAGLTFIELDETVPALRYVPAALNLFAFMFFLTGFTAMVSSWDRYRWRTIGWVGAIYMVQLILKVVARMAQMDWLTWFTFFGPFEPSLLASPDANVLSLSLWYDGCFLVLGLGCYGIATLVFCRRDLPAPL